MSFIVAGTGTVYQVHKNGSIWQYNGTPCNGNFCGGWLQIDNNPATNMVVPGL